MWFTGYCCGVKGRARTTATEEQERSKPGAVMGCTPSILSNGSNNQQQQQSRKDSSGLYAGNVAAAAAAAAAAASGNGSSSHGNECGASANNNKLGTVNQTMVNTAFPSARDGGTEKESSAKKDSIVSITASGHITSFPIVSTTVRRPTAGTSVYPTPGAETSLVARQQHNVAEIVLL
ncbi:hypothetical protein AND_008766 [Anopheles darlingi]|uniref:Uncharacterized protein n=1 Tax=Anopheles darlingi TaxID=43151 RepID=W5J9V5_ANODA|nr:hypothetical protein AND_008766 [Anopheles darlingi]